MIHETPFASAASHPERLTPFALEHPAFRHIRDRRGIIVLGPLILFLCLLVVMVVAGKIMYPEPRGLYVATPKPELQEVIGPAEVYSGERLVRRLRPGDQVWIVRLDNGSAVVFGDRSGRNLIGITRGLLAAEPSRRG